ncbi:hypothetical protein [Streptomyces subrutilus]|uniref:Uncharacterized protein n=1 Tax=Streptomyces subrutilus TaxID=36818 RepID=A0A1E5Q0L9_9ACTN|nr:hypothetical protein [Streptomyces subrutilus]OEJ35293.1 hypothetical protein BGK67_31930 [Streptomyces subrutilus]
MWDTAQAAVRRTSGSGEANRGSSNGSRSATAARTAPGATPYSSSLSAMPPSSAKTSAVRWPAAAISAMNGTVSALAA